MSRSWHLYSTTGELSDKARLRFCHAAYWGQDLCLCQGRGGDGHGRCGPRRPGPRICTSCSGVPREASRKDIAQAWRRRARAEHPNSRLGDAAAPGRFRALAGAWEVLGDRARRTAYDQSLARAPHPALHIPAAGPAIVTPTARMPGSPPLWAGPVRVERAHQAAGPGGRDEEETGLAVLAGLALHYLARDWDWPW